jgi:hypothetical protein
VDRLLDSAHAQIWTRAEFRQQRIRLGRMAADYLKLARRLAGLPDIELISIWGGSAAVQDRRIRRLARPYQANAKTNAAPG